MARHLSVFFLILCAIAMGGCAKKNSLYSEDKRSEMTRESDVVIEVNYLRMAKLREVRYVNVDDARKGFGKKPEQIVFFTVKKTLKGFYLRPDAAVAVSLASMAFGITPSEYPGQKKYTLYLKEDTESNRYQMIGAEWEQVF